MPVRAKTEPSRPQRADCIQRVHRTALCLASCTLFLLLSDCGDSNNLSSNPSEPVSSAQEPIHSSHSGSPPWPHVLTCYGGCDPPHYDSSACNHATSCGPIANGRWWYATERAAFHCHAKLKLERGDRCVVVDVVDNGPADWVEDNAAGRCGTGYIIDTSPLVHDYFGGGCGWGECFIINVSPVPDDTPTGPEGCAQCECQAGQQQSEGCGTCGTRTRTCGSNCHWGDWSGCDGQGPCSPGQTTSEACGNCGSHTRSCGSDCNWGGWSECEGQGSCSPGQTDSQACCDCGSQQRSCDSNCQWSSWSACEGPDPDQGNRSCDTGQGGLCAQGRVRCIQGCQSCARAYEPQPEQCDNLDNDCNGKTDEGSPTQMGTPPPPFAALLEDSSLPQSLSPGEVARAWASFRNVGSETWRKNELWLSSQAAIDGHKSPLYAPGRWPAWNIAAVLDSDVPPGQSAFFVFPVQIPADADSVIKDDLRLTLSAGAELQCPSPLLALSIRPQKGVRLDAGAEGGSLDESSSSKDSGCGCHLVGAPSHSPTGLGLWLSAAALIGLGRLRQGRSKRLVVKGKNQSLSNERSRLRC